VETVEIMRRIVEATETALPYEDWLMERRQWVDSGLVEAVCYAACELALQTGASAIVAPTESGFTAQMVSRFRPRQTILAPTTDERIVRRLSLFWGVYPRLVEVHGSIEEMLATAERVVREAGLLPRGGMTVVTAGIKPLNERGVPTTNTIHCIRDEVG
jgi:pyruvate kinase